jgi:hypothetical protein
MPALKMTQKNFAESGSKNENKENYFAPSTWYLKGI